MHQTSSGIEMVKKKKIGKTKRRTVESNIAAPRGQGDDWCKAKPRIPNKGGKGEKTPNLDQSRGTKFVTNRGILIATCSRSKIMQNDKEVGKERG
ncbi:hypothetical protein PoB_000389300 [Plakobranchus ocellatus]|uniref:Uncharacterized protein n=1 Tax=Plakobranchus ocellatus TaxID=259542 RepID=A0AAV3Y480_9GAST|nr:hypothetical protein PoB_000389300 [Plakobranchus ocellatus]